MVAYKYPNNSKNQSHSLPDVIVESIGSIKGGKILIEVENRPTIDIKASRSNEVQRIDIDILDPEIFDVLKNHEVNERKDSPSQDDDDSLIDSKNDSVDKIKNKLDTAKEFFHLFTDNEASIFDQLKIVKDFASKLTENNITIILHRKGKQAIIMGKDANPSISKIISRSDNLQIKSVKESSKLLGEISISLAEDGDSIVRDSERQEE